MDMAALRGALAPAMAARSCSRNRLSGRSALPCRRPVVLDAGGRIQMRSPRAQAQNSGLVEHTKGEQIDGARFMFHAEGGGQVRVLVQERSSKYVVTVEANLPDESPVHLHWGLFRSDSSDWKVLQSEDAPPRTVFLSGQDEAMQTPMERHSPSRLQTLRLDLPTDMAPFYMSFVFSRPALQGWIRSNSGSNFCVPLGLQAGRPDPLGVTLGPDGSANFALYSRHAVNVTLCLYGLNDVEPTMEIDLESPVHKTGDVWHVQLPSLEGFSSYGYRCKGEKTWDHGNRFHERRVLLDPYAKFLAPLVPGQDELPSPATALGLLPTNVPLFDWENDSHPCISLERLVCYRLDVVGFTSGLDERFRSTFLGVIEKISHFKFLGVNAIILQPIFSHDIIQGPYYPTSFFSPMNVYDSANTSLSASISFKEMVKALHKNGIELILDVVYTHTSEKGDEDPETVSFRGIDNRTYYVLDKNKRILQTDSGANLFNCNHPAVHKMIVDSLRYWVEEYHVDGFCFVNAHGLTKGPHGQQLSRPLLLEAISFDPLLANTKLLADPCSPGFPDAKGPKFPHWRRWLECNMSFKRDLTSFFLGDEEKLSDLATRICGSADVFADGRGPCFSLNHVGSAYGLTLADSLERRIEAPTSQTRNKTITDTRTQVRNLLVTLFLSQGVPVLAMGDEYAHTNGSKVGNRRDFDWDKLDANMDLCHLIASLSIIRGRYEDLFQTNKYVEAKRIKWHGPKPDEDPLWTSPESKFLALSLKSSKDGGPGDLCIAFNAEGEAVEMTLREEITWLRIVDTALPYPDMITIDGSKLSSEASSYEVQPCSVVVLQAFSNGKS